MSTRSYMFRRGLDRWNAGHSFNDRRAIDRGASSGRVNAQPDTLLDIWRTGYLEFETSHGTRAPSPSPGPQNYPQNGLVFLHLRLSKGTEAFRGNARK